ncbi:hypothetical protein ACLQ2R_32535 [Streptosporangium sp. DT93]|uniref:hypothetical protein n=1 Tax=Streptosporangium sp. DT93 TaxID=3393428 RepID=UPI003CEE9BD2
MPVATSHPDRRDTLRAREPGTPPRPLVVLASIVLAAGTGTAIWLLPSGATGEWAPRGDRPGAAATPSGTRSPDTPGTRPGRGGEPVVPRPSGFVTFVDTARDPRFNLSRAVRRDHVRWFTLGHLTAGRQSCVPVWDGFRERGGDPVADRLGRLRAAGGNAGLAFGGPSGRELASACTDPDRLAAAYRRAITAFGAAYVDFEIHGPAASSEPGAVRRRARAIAVLQREAVRGDRPLTVSFTVPVTGAGLSRDDQEMLRVTRAEGVEIATVNLLAPVGAPAAGARLRPVASAVRAAHPQVARSLGRSTAWSRIALTPVLTGSGGLTRLDARRLAAFTSRNRLAWLSTRGVALTPEVTRLLTGATR